MTVQLSEDASGFEIILKGEGVIGYITLQGNFLEHIEVFPEYRGNGYGKAAVGELVRQVSGDIRTSTIVSPAMQSIVDSVGFQPIESVAGNRWVYRE